MIAGALTLATVIPADVARMAELADEYRDAQLDPTDLSIIAIAERRNITQIATLDRRDFTIVRPAHCPAFTL